MNQSYQFVQFNELQAADSHIQSLFTPTHNNQPITPQMSIPNLPPLENPIPTPSITPIQSCLNPIPQDFTTIQYFPIQSLDSSANLLQGTEG